MLLTGNVNQIVYRNDSGWVIFNIYDRKSKKLVKVTGVSKSLKEGDSLEIIGNYEESKKYGISFKASSITKTIPTDVALYAKYLTETIDGVGSVIASNIVRKFGRNTFQVIREQPELLAEVPMVSERKAKAISEQFIANSMTQEERMFFMDLGISDSISAKIKEAYKGEYKEKVKRNPYGLIHDIDGVGFDMADKIALCLGIKRNSAFRIRSGIEHALDKISNQEGHAYSPKDGLLKEASKLLRVSYREIEAELEECVKEKFIVIQDGNIYLKKYYDMECYVADTLLSFLGHSGSDDDTIRRRVMQIEKRKGIELDELQRDAVVKSANNELSVITGGPGVGKTTVLDVLIEYLSMYETGRDDIMMLAPTGRAAKRINEQTGMDAMTIHRVALSLMTASEGSGKLENRTVIVDEMSMVDLPLMKMLLDILDIDTRIVLVGDVDQLPSIGVGRVLRDIIDSKVVPTSRLTKIFRQAADSHIVKNAHMINKGQTPDLATKHDDFFCVSQTTEDIIIKNLKILIKERLPRKFGIGVNDAQILAPMRKGKLGIDNLNLIMQEAINPPSKEKAEYKAFEKLFRVGDKVMHTKNNYDIEWYIKSSGERGSGVFNGEVGYVEDIDFDAGEIYIRYDDERIATYDAKTINQVELAYAITIHKSQGSEYPAIVMPLLTKGPSMLYNRNLMYTGVTRAKECVAILGNPNVVADMIRNTDSQKRYSTLAERLMEGGKGLGHRY